MFMMWIGDLLLGFVVMNCQFFAGHFRIAMDLGSLDQLVSAETG